MVILEYISGQCVRKVLLSVCNFIHVPKLMSDIIYTQFTVVCLHILSAIMCNVLLFKGSKGDGRWFGLVVVSLVASTMLLNVEPG